jgi:hypothetical protein
MAAAAACPTEIPFFLGNPRTIGDDGGRQRWIRSIARKGFRVRQHPERPGGKIYDGICGTVDERRFRTGAVERAE